MNDDTKKPSQDTKAATGPYKIDELPSGAKIVMRTKPKMKHLLKGARMVDKDSMAIGLAVASIVCTIDGQSPKFEDMVEHMDIADGLKLTEMVMGNVSSSTLERILGS